jgi:hypothetical protein
MIKTGQLLAVIKPGGLFVIYSPLIISETTNKILHEDKIFSKYVPIGEIILCLEANYHAHEALYGLKVLWKDYVYYLFCEINDVKVLS